MFEAQVRLIRERYGIQPGEVDLPMLPIFALFNPALGMTTVVPEIDPSRPATVDPAKIVQAIRQEKVTNSFGSPTLWAKISTHCQAQGITLPSLRRVLCAGAPVPASLWESSAAWLPGGQLHSPYGATESLPVATISAAEIRLIVEQGSQQGVIEAEEEQMIGAVMSLGESKLHEVMVPRIDIAAIDTSATFDEAVEVVLKEGHSRTPLYEGSIDHVVGILYAKDLLRIIAAGGPRPRLVDIMRPALFAPESQSVDDLLHELQRRKVHMAIVLDEYGGTAGLVTIEDLIEEIVGEIQDEFDEEEPMRVEVARGEVLLDGRAGIDQLTELIDPPLDLEDDEEYDTVGGFVYHRIGRVPVVGDAVEVAPFSIAVIKVSGRRVGKVRVRWEPIEAAESSND